MSYIQKAKRGSVGAVVVLVVLCLGYGAMYHSTAEDFTLHVTKSAIKGDSGSQTFRVWGRVGDGSVEAFEVRDSFWFFTWNASDRYGRLEEGTDQAVRVAGWRIRLFSSYRNIVEVKE